MVIVGRERVLNMNIIRLLELVNECKIKDHDYFKSSHPYYDDVIYLNNELYYYDLETEDIRDITFSDIAEMLNDKVLFSKYDKD